MKGYREQFEEVWPVPDVIFWSQEIGRYSPMPDEVFQYERLNEQWAHEHNARLDTFTRCQETTDFYVSLVDDLVKEIESCYGQLRMSIAGDLDRFYVSPVLDRAKKIIVRNGFESRNK